MYESSMLVLTVILALISNNGCSGFTLPSITKINSLATSASSIEQQRQQQQQKRRTRIIPTTTKLFAQQKKPRFSQQGSHIARKKKSEGSGAEEGSFKSNNNNNARRTSSNPTSKTTNKPRQPPQQRRPSSPSSSSSSTSSSQPQLQPNQPWKSGRSLDDLESTMSKRWGTLDDSSRSMSGNDIPDGFEISYDDEENDDSSNTNKKQKTKVKNKKQNNNKFSEPVLDPWDDDEEENEVASTGVREYYDQDDEGFEFLDDDDEEVDEDDYIYDEDNDEYIPRVDHLIAPQPAGGRGTNHASDKKLPSGGGGYFFNPDAAKAPSKDDDDDDLPVSRKDHRKRDRDTAQNDASDRDEDDESSSSKRRDSRPVPPTALLEESTGKVRLLTVAEAFRQFQDSVDEGTMEIIESADVPILAQKVNAQSWEDLGITSTEILGNLQYEMNCPNPLAVQEKTTPAILTGNDVLVGTYTGSGKTLSFLVPLVQRLLWNSLHDDDDDDDDNEDTTKLKNNNIGLAVIIVAPGRELASQIVSVARDLLQDTGLTAQLAIGGTGFKRNLEQLRKRKPNIIVGTPGRIAELVVGKPGEKSGRLKVSSLQSLVLDEFDALLEYKAHRDPTRAIMQNLKRRHGNALQSVLCSATATDIMDSSKVIDFLRPGFEKAMADEDDVLVTGRVTTDGKSSSTSIAAQVSRTVIHGVVHVPHKRLALDAVRRILHTDPIPQQILIFVDNARKVDIVVEKLADRGIIAAALHGGMGSEKMDRAEVSKALREGYVGIVVATELAARGLDAPLLTHVINLDLPTDASHYAHRSGRCGRGGRPGVVINITTSNVERNVPKRFTDTLGVELFTVEPRAGKLIMVDPATQTLDRSRDPSDRNKRRK